MSVLGPTIGFLVDTLAEDYQRRLFAGLNEEAARLEVNVVCAVGGQLSVFGPITHRNRVYDAMSGQRLHGLVVASGTLGNQVSEQALAAFVESFQPLPTCSVGIELLCCPSVTIDNQAGVREALHHLLNEVGRRRIAFIRGPESNREAEERFRVYRDVLAEHRLPLDPDLITMGDFEAASGAHAVRTLIDERRMGFDAIMAASDLMALGALNALSERGVPVPARVSVVGFDDIEAARFATSPLTTVRQPLMDLGKRALQSVIEQLNQEPTGSTVLPARLVRRESSSTGPESHNPLDSMRNIGVPDSASFEQSYRTLRAELFDELQAEVPGIGVDDWPEQLCNSFVSEASGRRAGLLNRSTLEYLEHLLLRVAEADGDTNAFQGVITRMRARLRPLMQGNLAIANRAEDLWHRARVLIGGIAERYQVQHRLQLRHWRRSISEVGAELMRAASLPQLQELVSTQLVTLGIPACAVCAVEPSGFARVCATFDATTPQPESTQPYPLERLLPDGILSGPRRRSLVAETLYLHDRTLGYLICEMGPTEPEAYEMLRDYLTGALRGLLDRGAESSPPPSSQTTPV